MGFIKVIAFDCDGVLFDTEDANKTYYNNILAHFGLPPMTEDQFAYTQMHTADEAINHLFENRLQIEAANAYRKQSGYDPYIKYMKMDPDLIPVLERYRNQYKIAVATNRSDTMGKVLAEHGIEKYFDLVVTSLDVPRPKPHPDSLVQILKFFNIVSHEMIYIGDSKLDEMAAKEAGIPFVACRNHTLDGDFHIKRLIEIEKILKNSHGK